MQVLERAELEASPLADLHAIADQLGLDDFRRLRKAELIDALLQAPGARSEEGAEDLDALAQGEAEPSERGETETSGKRVGRRAPRLRRSRAPEREQDEEPEEPSGGIQAAGPGAGSASRAGRERGEREASRRGAAGRQAGPERIAEGVVELLGNGSAFLRVNPPEPSDEDVYISAAQVRRCELVSGDHVSGPVRTPRRAERYPSLVRIDSINGAPADSVSERARYEDMAVAYPHRRLVLSSEEPILKAIEWLTPLGLGSRAVIVGARWSGKTTTLRRLLQVLSGEAGGGDAKLEPTLVLVGVRPEEITDWQQGPLAPAAALAFSASADAQSQAVERAVEAAKRVAARGGDALVLIDSLDGLHPHAARKALTAARQLRGGGSLTLVATASRPFGGETTVIALDPAPAHGDGPVLDLVHSGTLRAELLVGEDGARAIAQARLEAMGEGR
jgi:transcription termination factor Rho